MASPVGKSSELPSDDENSYINNSPGEITPHIERILRLIEGGSDETVDAAVDQLFHACVDGGPILQWRILGRLQATLCSVKSSWKTRTQTALALERVAQLVPPTDQRLFWDQTFISPSMNNCAKKKSTTSPPTIPGAEEKDLFLSINDVDCDLFWLNLAQSGRELYATASTKWEEDEQAYEQEILKDMMSQGDDQNSVVQHRTKWQRIQLAKRMGLQELAVVDNEVDFLSEDLSLSNKQSNPRKRPRISKSLQSEETSNALDPSTTMQNLLVEQMQKSLTKQSKSQLDSQHLLATEFLYNMWSPSWIVRHGALLGLLALVRAWQEALMEASSHSSSWSQDLLVRSMALLALDRFGDFSGAFLIQETDETSKSSRYHGAVVAPVRETAGQLIAILFRLMRGKSGSFSMKHRILSSLNHCLHTARAAHASGGDTAISDVWETRHGILVAFKYISILLWGELERRSIILSNNQERLLHPHETDDKIQALNLIIKAAIEHMNDPSDDVVSAAAHVLRVCANHLDIRLPEVGSEVALDATIVGPIVYDAAIKTKSHSSSVPELIGLLSALLAHRPKMAVDVSKIHGIDHFIDMLLGLLNSDFESVQVSALKALGSISVISETAIMSTNAISESGTLAERKCSLLKSFSRVLSRLFTSIPLFATIESEKQLVHTWQKFCKAMKYLSKSSITEFHSHEQELYLQLFSNSDLCSGSGYFQFIDKSSDLLVFMSSCTPGPFPRKELISLLKMYLKSPWIGQCEASCLLVSKLVGQPEHSRDSLQLIEMSMQQMLTAEVECTNQKAFRSWGNPGIFQLCNEAMSSYLNDNRHSDSMTFESVLSLWDRAIHQGEAIYECRGPSLDVLSMRLRAVASSAALTLGMPQKITPFVRPLMSSLKSESCRTRLRLTVDSLVGLLKRMGEIQDFRPAFVKILGSLTQAAITESLATTRNRYRPACDGLGKLASIISVAKLCDKSSPTWKWLQNLSSGARDCPMERLLSSIHLVRVLCSQASRSGNDTVRFLACLTQERLTSCALKHDDEHVRTAADAALLTMVAFRDPKVIQLLLRGTLVHLLDNASQDTRIRSCHLISILANKSGTSFTPFVRGLLPITMRMMRDRSSECSAIATEIFACLVQLAPLVRLEDSLDLGFSSEDSHTSAVIDHLILGLPIPPCTLPTNVSHALSQNGIELRSYQLEGVSWLHFLQRIYLNGALCDCMGLGKTLQALVAIALAHSQSAGSTLSLVVCPSTLVEHWICETQKLFPGDKVFRPIALVGSVAGRQKLWESIPLGKNLIITSYTVLRSDIDRLEKVNYEYCCLDEAHLLRNPKTATSKASRRISAVHRLILSGTMIQNRVEDIWAAFDFLMPNFLGSSEIFMKQYGTPIAKSHSISATAEEIKIGGDKLKNLHQKVLPFILRREKEHVLKELPPKNIMMLKCRMSEVQRKVYAAFMSSQEMKKSVATLQRALDADGRENGTIGSDVLKTLFFMRLLCTHPALISSQKGEVGDRPAVYLQDSGKLLALAEIFRSLGIEEQLESAADNDTSVLFCRQETGAESDVFSSISDSSTFAPISNQAFQTHERSKSKCLVFAQFSQSLDAVEEALLRPRVSSSKYLRMDGSVSPSRRGEMANQFNSDPSIRIMLLTTRVGSLGLNLTGADTVIFLEHDWNPFVDLQAMDRAHRLGQSRQVNVYRLVMQDTIEERIMDLQKKKTEMNEAVVNSENSSLFSLGTDRLLDIFTVDKADRGAESDGFDLDGLLAKYGDDYAASLSVSEFSRKASTSSSS